MFSHLLGKLHALIPLHHPSPSQKWEKLARLVKQLSCCNQRKKKNSKADLPHVMIYLQKNQSNASIFYG